MPSERVVPCSRILVVSLTRWFVKKGTNSTDQGFASNVKLILGTWLSVTQSTASGSSRGARLCVAVKQERCCIEIVLRHSYPPSFVKRSNLTSTTYPLGHGEVRSSHRVVCL
jgi:hypothetical protein